ncbi:hypothetical protein [Streptomyces sp. NPDC015130]|uniref:hypothetical protein n=1 Tax=Streptomyces sp. NPDC015130 TaxID=3364940 RepID=UPI0036FD594B
MTVLLVMAIGKLVAAPAPAAVPPGALTVLSRMTVALTVMVEASARVPRAMPPTAVAVLSWMVLFLTAVWAKPTRAVPNATLPVSSLTMTVLWCSRLLPTVSYRDVDAQRAGGVRGGRGRGRRRRGGQRAGGAEGGGGAE